MSAQPVPPLIFQGVGFGGLPLPGGKLYSYIAGTSTPQATYTDSTESTPNTNPVILNSNGQAPVWIDPTKSYKFILTDALGNQIYTTNNINSPPVANWANVITYGADPTGSTDSSAAFTSALNSGATFVLVPPPNSGDKYIVHDVVIPNGVTLFAYGAYFVDAIGAQWMFKLNGYSSRLLGAYISSALNCAQAVVIVENCFLAQLSDLRIVNCTNGIRFQVNATTPPSSPPNTDHVQLINCWVDTFTGIGMDVGPNCSETRAVNCYMDAGLVSGTGGLIPRTGTTGFRIYGTGSTFAYGGHCFTQCQASNTQDGFYLNNSNLVNLTGCIADDNSGRGFAFDGTTSLCVMTGCFTGPAWNGIWAGGTTQTIWATGLTTINNGTIVAGYGSNFYTSATAGYNGYSASANAYDIVTVGSADIIVDADTWMASQGTAHAYNVGAGSNLAITGGLALNFSTPTTIAANSTVYIGPTGTSTTDQQIRWMAPFNCVVQEFHVIMNSAPGSGQTYTYTLSVNGSATALTGSVTGTGVFELDVVNGTQVGISKGNGFTLKLATSAASGVAYHSGFLKILPQP